MHKGNNFTYIINLEAVIIGLKEKVIEHTSTVYKKRGWIKAVCT